jgi:hypothetical protein
LRDPSRLQATPAQIAAAEKESASRLAACTTAECRQVIEALNTKKLAKLKGAARLAWREIRRKAQLPRRLWSLTRI